MNNLVKRILLSKIALYIVIAIMTVSALSAWAAAESSSSKFRNTPNGVAIVVGVCVSFAPYFIASVAFAAYLAKKYGMFLRKGKSTTVDNIASSIRRKDVDNVRFEIQCLIDRGYLPGFTINHETNAITPIAAKDTVQELAQTMTKTISAFKKPAPETPSACPKCGAATPGPDAVNCEFCGSPLPR